MINISEVLETNKMIEKENLDVRTITMGISLLDCIDSDVKVLCSNIYRKITSLAEDLVKTGDDIAKEYGIPIVNKRISVTPIALVGGTACRTSDDYVQIALALDKAAEKLGVNFIGGYSAIVSKGMTHSDELLIRSIPQALACTEHICSSVNVGSTKTGINMDAVRLMGEIIKETAELTKEKDSLGCAKLVVLCNAPDDNPFMAGAFHGVSENDAVINVGVSGPGVVKYALEQIRGESFEVLCETIKRTAFKITRVGQLVAQEASRRLGVPFGIIDLSLAPTPAVGDSVAEILQEIGVEYPGAPGTNIRIRGIGTFGGSSASPLVLVDGVQGNIDDVDPSQIDKFTYKGTLPTTCEQVTVMMADAVEAASRSLKDYSKESISELVDRILSQRISDSQLAMADISIREINIIKDVFKKHLGEIYHARIVYPKKEEPDALRSVTVDVEME